jgi:hypothetical protein
MRWRSIPEALSRNLEARQESRTRPYSATPVPEVYLDYGVFVCASDGASGINRVRNIDTEGIV